MSIDLFDRGDPGAITWQAISPVTVYVVDASIGAIGSALGAPQSREHIQSHAQEDTAKTDERSFY
jgi:hypothetical protein